VSYGLFLPPGDFSLALDVPVNYAMWGGGSALFGIDVTAAYTAPFWLGFRTTANFIAAPDPAFEGMEFAVNYTQAPFYGELTLKAKESFRYFILEAEFDYFFNFFILNAGVALRNLGSGDTVTAAPAIGIKYRF
jgi:hypothetical protein